MFMYHYYLKALGILLYLRQKNNKINNNIDNLMSCSKIIIILMIIRKPDILITYYIYAV